MVFPTSSCGQFTDWLTPFKPVLRTLDRGPVAKDSLALLLAGGRFLALLLRRGGSARLLGRLGCRFGHRAAPLGLALLIEMRHGSCVTHLFQIESNPLKRQERVENLSSFRYVSANMCVQNNKWHHELVLLRRSLAANSGNYAPLAQRAKVGVGVDFSTRKFESALENIFCGLYE